MRRPRLQVLQTLLLLFRATISFLFRALSVGVRKRRVMPQRRDKRGAFRRLFGRRRLREAREARGAEGQQPCEQSQPSEQAQRSPQWEPQVEFIPSPVHPSGQYGPPLPTFRVHLPKDKVKWGASFTVTCGHATRICVTIPRNVRLRDACMHVVLPPALLKPKTYQMALPPELLSRQRFYIPLETRLVALVCPNHYIPGQTLRFEVPFSLPEIIRVSLPESDQALLGKFVRLKRPDGKHVWCKYRPDWKPGQSIRLDSSHLKAHAFDVTIREHGVPGHGYVLPGRRFLVCAEGKTMAIDAPLDGRKTARFTVPWDIVEATNLALVDAHPSVPDASCWNMLTSDALAHLLDFLSLREMRDCVLAFGERALCHGRKTGHGDEIATRRSDRNRLRRAHTPRE